MPQTGSSLQVVSGATGFGRSWNEELRFSEIHDCLLHCSTALSATNKAEYQGGEKHECGVSSCLATSKYMLTIEINRRKNGGNKCITAVVVMASD